MTIGSIKLSQAFRHHATGEVESIPPRSGGRDVGFNPANEAGAAPALDTTFKPII